MFIAEVKTCSPFGFKSEHTWEHLFDVAKSHGDFLSIHTDERWEGNYNLLRIASSRSNKPILAKGIHSTDDEILKCLKAGADKVLVVGRIPRINLIKHCYIEPINLDQLKMIPIDTIVVWNSRDLSNGKLKDETWEDARNIFKGTLIQASNIKNKLDLKPDCDGYIVGQNLIEFTK